jgi:hypothetical protein
MEANMSSKDSDGVLIRTESHYVQKLGSGVYRESEPEERRRSFSNVRHRIDRITEESESRDKHTLSRNVEEGSSSGMAGDNKVYSQSYKRIDRKTPSSQNISSKTEKAPKIMELEENVDKHNREQTNDSIKKYLDFYDNESEMEEYSSRTNGSFIRKQRSKQKIEAQTLEYLENYEATDEQTSPTETENKISSKRINTHSQTKKTGDLSSLKSMEIENKNLSKDRLPKYNTFNNFENIMNQDKGMDEVGNGAGSENVNSFVKAKDNDHKYIEIRDMVLQNSGRSYSNNTQPTLDIESPPNSKGN